MGLSQKYSLLLAALLLAACRSDPIHYHTLMPAQASPPSSTASVELQIERVSVPAQVDRAQLVIREGGSGLAILETQWWGASLADELRSALQDQLASSGGQPRVGLQVQVQRFDSVPGQYALMDVSWRLRALGVNAKGAALNCRSVLQTPAGASLDALVAAHQQNVKRLAAQINQAAAGGRGCPAVQ